MEEKLKEALKQQGLSEGLADVLRIATEDDIEGVISLLKPTPVQMDIPTFLESEALQNYVKDHGFEKVLEHSKTLQSEHDKKVTAGINSFKQRKDTAQEPPTADDQPQWARELQERMAFLETEKKQNLRVKEAQDLLEKSNLPSSLQAKWLNRIDLSNKAPIESQVMALEKEFETLNNQFLNSKNGLPTGGISDGTISEKEAEEIADELI